MQRLITSIILAAFVLHPGVSTMASTALTYQGRLDAGGQAFDGSVDMVFELFDAEAGGTAVGAPIAINGVSVHQGLFQVELDFGAQAWEAGRWLQITVEGQPLTPRQKVTGAPLAWRAETVVEEGVGSQELEDGGVQAVDIANGSIHSNHIVNGTIVAADIASNSLTGLQIANGSIHGSLDIQDDTITSIDIKDGTVNGTDTDRSFWNSVTRGNLSMLADGLSVNAGILGTATARCESPDDVPVTGECFADNFANVNLRRFGPEDWEASTTAGGWSCTYANTGASTVTIEARIYCLDVIP